MDRAAHVYALYHRGFVPVLIRNEDVGEPLFLGEERHGENAPYAFDPPIKGKLSGYQVVVKPPAAEDSHGGKHADGNGKIVGRTLFAHIRGRQVHYDPVIGEFETRIMYGCP